MARVYAVASAKGGVGKSTTTANLAGTLAAADYDVAVVDGDIGMANLAGMLGVEVDGSTLHDVLAGGADVADATYRGPHGMSVVPGDTDLGSYGDAEPRRLGGVVGAFADREFVFVDTGAGLSHETALPLGLVDDVVLVSTPERDALVDTDKTRELTERLDGSVVGAVLTRVAGDAAFSVDTGPLEVPVLGVVPEDEALAAATAAGAPVTRAAPDGVAAAGYREVASELADGPVRPPATDPADLGETGAGGTDAGEPVDLDPDPEAKAHAGTETATEATPTSEPTSGGTEVAGSSGSDAAVDDAGDEGPSPGAAAHDEAPDTEPDDGPTDDDDDDGGFLGGLFG